VTTEGEKKRPALARETLVWLSPERRATIELEIRHVYGVRTTLRESRFVRDPSSRGVRALVHTFEASGRDRGVCFAWFEGATEQGSQLVLVLQTTSIPDAEAALRAYRKPGR
jgi:hypothetical protein